MCPEPRISTHEEWLEERVALLRDEKELGPARLHDLFQGNSQLLVYHFMFGEDYTAGCPSCSSIADGFNGFEIHLAHHDVTLCAVSRAPIEKLTAYKRRMGWTFPWASSHSSDFNLDFQAGCTPEQQQSVTEYNFAPRDNKASLAVGDESWARDIAAGCGTDWPTYVREQPGMSAFVLRDGAVYHTYSAYSRGLDGLWGMYQWLDRAPFGRNEDEAGLWWRRHDEY